MPRTFSIHALGCKVNQYEAEQLAAILRSRGLSPAAAGDAADVRVVHTCSVTVQAASKSRQSVRRAVAGGATGPSGATVSAATVSSATVALPVLPPTSGSVPAGFLDAPAAGARPSRVVVTGCWATSDPAAAAALPGVDAVVTHHGDVAAELDALLARWRLDEPVSAASADGGTTCEQADGSHPDRRRQTVPAHVQVEGWDSSAGTPAGILFRISKPLPAAGVNVKIAAGSTPQTLDGTAVFAPESATRESAGRPAATPRATGPALFAGTSTLPLLSDHQTGRQRALLKVQDGCDAHCTYCIIPTLRPGVRSKPIDDAVAEAARLVAGGHVEIVLTGIFLGAYGQETALRRRQAGGRERRGGEVESGGAGDGPNASEVVPSSALPLAPSPFPSSPLADLVAALCTRVPGLHRLRLSSLEPGDLTADLLAVLRAHPQVVPHFHLPLQSGSDAILRRMNRQYGRDDFLRMVDRVRAAFDRPALTTDVIVGFPGETDAEFARTAEVVEAAGFIGVHAFGFSPRPGTAAARWQNDVVRGPVVNERIAALRSAADRHSLAFRRTFVGETLELLVEQERQRDVVDAQAGDRGDGGPTGGRHGRCERYFPVWFDDPTARPGDFARVRVESVTPTRTHGVRVG